MPRSLPIPIVPDFDSTAVTSAFAGVFEAQLAPGTTFPATVTSIVGLIAAVGSVKLAVELLRDITEIVENLTEIYLNLQKMGLIEGGGDCCDEIIAALTATNPDGSHTNIADILRRGLITQATIDDEPLDRGIAETHERLRRGLYWIMPDGTIIPLGESLGRLVYTGVLHAGAP